MSVRSLYEAVSEAVRRRTDLALFAEGRTWTYGDLLDAAGELATHLERDPDRGQPVVAQVGDPVGTAVLTLAGGLSGVPVVHRDPAAADTMPGRQIHDGRVRAPGAGEVRCADGRLWLHRDGDCKLPGDLPPGSQVFLTSGSTGIPGAVVRTADAVLADARRVADALGYAPDAPVVCAAPLFHAYGFNYGLLGPLLTGAPVRWCPSRTIPSQLGRAVQQAAARTLIALPAHYGLFATLPGLADPGWDALLGTLRAAVSAGGPLAAGAARAVTSRFAFGLHNCYGSSEAGAVTLTRLTGAEDGDWIGSPLPGITARIEQVEDTSEWGELLLRTSSLAVERIGPSGREPLARPDGWYPTGDLAVADPSGGGIRLVGRVSSVINVAGKKVSPIELERVLATHPQIADVQVLAAVDPARGQVPVARVVLRDPAVAPQLARWCRDRLAPHQVPRRFEPVAEINRSATGKALAHQASERRAGQEES